MGQRGKSLTQQALGRDGWELRAKAGGGKGWSNFALVAPAGETQKRKYYGGWNGERLARNRDMDILSEHLPHIYEWLVKILAIL